MVDTTLGIGTLFSNIATMMDTVSDYLSRDPNVNLSNMNTYYCYSNSNNEQKHM